MRPAIRELGINGGKSRTVIRAEDRLMEDKPNKRVGTVLKTDCPETSGVQVLCLSPYGE